MADETILETKGLTKEFKGFVAVKDVSLKVRRGSIHALIGPNGAGKTTCFNLLTHFLTPTRGQIFYKGEEITGSSPSAIAQMGLVRSFQISAVFPHLTVLENVRIALQRKRGHSFDFWRSEGVLTQLNEEARRLIDAVGLAEFENSVAVELAYGRKRALEIATTLALDPEMLLTGEQVDARTALEWGLVNRVVPPAELAAETDKLARELAGKPPQQLAAGKRAFYQQMDLGIAKAYELASGVISSSFAHEEGRQGVDAFLEKRKPPRH